MLISGKQKQKTKKQTGDKTCCVFTETFPVSRGLSRRGKLKREERPLLASDELFDEAANQISGRNLPVFKTGFV